MSFSIILLIIVVIIVAVGALLLMDKGRSSDRKNKATKIKSDVRALRPMAGSNDPSQRRDALIKADSLFSKAMQLKLYNDSSAGENLKELRGKYDKKSYNDIWEAHKKRNRIVHENEEVSQSEAKQYLNTFIKSIDKLI